MDFINHVHTSAAGAATTSFIPAPFTCVLLGAYAVADYEAGSDTTIDIYNGSTKQIGISLASGTSLGDVAAGSVEATNIFQEGDPIKVVVSDDEGAAEGNISLAIKIDPFLAGASERNS